MPGMSRVYLSSSGSEANEKAYKMVRQIAHKKYGGKKHKILYRELDYHGTTIGALSSTGHPQRRAQFGPFVPGFVEVPHCCEYRAQWGETDYGYKAARVIEETILREGPDTVGAIVLETITAGGGVIPAPEGYWEEVQRICKKYDVLLHLDEVVTGMGRTGKWFGYQHYDIKPDIVTMAKGVASGYAAISCTVTTEEIFELFKEDSDNEMSCFRDISTFGGCLSGPAAALENMKIIEEEGLLENAAQIGDFLVGKLERLKEKYHIIGDVRGKGLLCGLELVADSYTKRPLDEFFLKRIVGICKEAGLLVGFSNKSLNNNNILMLSPPFTVNVAQAHEMVEIIDNAIDQLMTEYPELSNVMIA